MAARQREAAKQQKAQLEAARSDGSHGQQWALSATGALKPADIEAMFENGASASMRLQACEPAILAHVARLTCEEEDEAAIAACIGPGALPETAWRRTRHASHADRLKATILSNERRRDDCRFAVVPAMHSASTSTHPVTGVLLASLAQHGLDSSSHAVLEMLSVVATGCVRAAALSMSSFNMDFAEGAEYASRKRSALRWLHKKVEGKTEAEARALRLVSLLRVPYGAATLDCGMEHHITNEVHFACIGPFKFGDAVELLDCLGHAGRDDAAIVRAADLAAAMVCRGADDIPLFAMCSVLAQYCRATRADRGCASAATVRKICEDFGLQAESVEGASICPTSAVAANALWRSIARYFVGNRAAVAEQLLATVPMLAEDEHALPAKPHEIIAAELGFAAERVSTPSFEDAD